MNYTRRNFLARLCLAPAAALLFKQQEEITPPVNPYVTEPFKGKYLVLINPEWKDAPYEIAYIPMSGDAVARSYPPMRFRNQQSAEYYLKRLSTRQSSGLC